MSKLLKVSDSDDSNMEKDDSFDTESQMLMEKKDLVIKQKSSQEDRFVVLGVDLTSWTPASQFSVLSLAVCVLFMTCGWIEEKVFKTYPGFKFGWYLTTFELFEFSVFACLERKMNGAKNVLSMKAPARHHLYVGAAMTGARGLTNMSLQFLNYPTQVIFKSLKLIAIMIGSVFMLRKKYSVEEYAGAVLLVTSAIIFSLGDMETSPAFSVIGICIVLASLVGDRFHANFQEHVLKEGAHMLEVMIFSNFYSGLICLAVITLSGEIFTAIAYCNMYPSLYLFFTFRTVFVYGGALCYVAMIKRFGAVPATAVTTVRKILSIMLSFYIFPKPFSGKYIIAGFAFIGGIAFSLQSKIKGNGSKS
eukprot:44474_1